jgi:hypothetical protein
MDPPRASGGKDETTRWVQIGQACFLEPFSNAWMLLAGGAGMHRLARVWGLRSWQVIAHWVRPASLIDKNCPTFENQRNLRQGTQPRNSNDGGHLSTRLPQTTQLAAILDLYHNFLQCLSRCRCRHLHALSLDVRSLSWSP